MLVVRGLLLLAVVASASRAMPQTMTFEQDPAGALPVDDSALTDPYNLVGGGVRLYFDANGNSAFDAAIDVAPLFEAAGQDTFDGFSNGSLVLNDVANGGLDAQLGSFFLRQPASFGNLPGPLIAEFSVDPCMTVTGFSGEIWDIDGNTLAGQGNGTEQWRLDAMNGAGVALASQTSPLGNVTVGGLDGLPWGFALTNLPLGVTKVSFSFLGTKTEGGIGLAFNNFATTIEMSLTADYDGSGDVDALDFLVWKMNYPTPSGATQMDGDADMDGDVDGTDLLFWQTQFGCALPMGATVPEPASFVLVAWALLRRRPQRI
jgi:hypothetical protein